MNWPSPKDFNDAIRNPGIAFTDPDLSAGDPVVGSDGRPLSHPGDSSNVYQVCAEDDRAWAVKCFTRPVPSLAHRYARIQEALARPGLPFAVRFSFLKDGVRVGEQQYPILKMDWVEGLPLNQVVRDRAESPAVMETLFRRWVLLCRELREAGIAHGDLQHANVVLIPGAWPGAYTLKLIDYDALYAPALADTPSDEAGHPNYQHPARTAASYSPDLDRFSHLVIATALKGLAVLGPPLWKRYDTGDNLLFTAADFRNPAASRLMRELWQTNNPALQTLVGKLALACGQPIHETPWLDELAAEGSEVRLTVEETHAAVSALGLESAVTTSGKQPGVVPVEVLSLNDDEPEETPRQQPRAKPKAKTQPRAEPRRKFLLVPVAIAACLLIAAGAAWALWPKPEKTAQVPPDDTPPPVEPAPQPAPPLTPTPELPAIAPPPRLVPVYSGPPGFHRLWDKPAGDERTFVKGFFTGDGQAVFVAIGNRIEAFDAKTGEARQELRGPGLPTSAQNIWSLGRDRVVVFGYPLKAPVLWDTKTGDQLPSDLSRDPLPPPPPGIQAATIECQVSPDGKYVFAGYQGQFRSPTHTPTPYRVTEVSTGKVVVQGEWTYGTARFTADGSRLLMTETNGRVRWIKTATGEVEIEWAFQPNAFPRMIGGMSADGSLFVYFGKPPGLPFDNYLVDGKTGQVLRKLGVGFNGDRSIISADGRWLVGVVNEPPDFRRFSALITDARTGEVLVRTPMEGDQNDFQRVSLTADGKAFIMHHRGKREVAVYALRGDVPAVPAGIPTPAPLTPVPARVLPGAPMAVVPPVVPPDEPPPQPPRPPLPVAAALKSRLTIATDTGIMANQMPQLPLYSKDGKVIILAGGNTGTILTFDAKTGAAGGMYDGHKGPGGVLWLAPFGGDRVASGGFDGKQATWDTKTGKRVDDVKFAELPAMPAGVRGHAGMTYTVSPSGRYTAIGRKESAGPAVPGPLRVLDTTTGEVVAKADWNGGTNGGAVAFTADESRVFVLDGLGKATWYKLPSGEVDGQWRTGDGVQAEQAKLLGMTADGKTLLYRGPLAGQPYGVYLLDGKTGQVVRRLNPGAPYQAAFSSLSPDGKFVVMMVIDFNGGPIWYADLFEVATWRLVGRIAPPEKSAKEPPHFGFSPDGKDLAVFYPAAKELSLFSLPEGAVQAIVPPVVVPDPPRAGDAPALKPDWIAASGVGRAAAQFRYDPETKRIVLGNPAESTVAVFDVGTGRPPADKLDGLRWDGAGDLYVLPGGRIGFHYRTDQTVAVWDLKAGKAGDPIAVPDLPLGPDRRNHRSVWLSPDGKFLAVARNATPQATAPLRVCEVATGKALVSLDWEGGAVHFTADSARVLVAEAGGKCRWFKLPSGEASDRWELPKPEGGLSPRVTAISADGALVGYTGPGIGANRAPVAVLNGKTGEVVRGFGAEYLPGHLSLSADGKLAAVLRRPRQGEGMMIDVIEMTGGRVIGRATVRSERIVPIFFLTPDGRAARRSRLRSGTGVLVPTPGAAEVRLACEAARGFPTAEAACGFATASTYSRSSRVQ